VSRLLRAELIKLRTTRTFYALAGVAIGISLVITVLVASLTEPSKDNVLNDVFQTDTSSLFIMILAIVGITGEWRHRTITSSLLAAPDRTRFLAAKTLAFAAAGALLSIGISIAIAIAGYAILGVRDLPTPELGELIGQIGRNAGVATLLGAFGVGVGSVVRNQPIAIVGILIVSFVIDPTLGALAPGVERFSPTGALPSAIQGLKPDDVGLPDVDFLGFGVALALMAAWIAAMFAAGAGLLRARDVD
jgi:ABC-2 type transport system permease protein